MQSHSFFSAENNSKRAAEVATLDSLNLTGIFALFLKETWHRFLEESARFYLFPIAAAGAAISALLAIRQAYIENRKKGTYAKAVLEVGGALAIGTAVIGGLVASAAFAAASPIIFTATLGVKTLFHGFASAYYWGKSVATKNNPEKAEMYREQMKSNLVATGSLALATVAVGVVMLAAKPIAAIVGVVAGGIGAAYSFYNRFIKRKSAPAASIVLPRPDKTAFDTEASEPLLQNTVTARLFARVGQGLDAHETRGSITPQQLDAKQERIGGETQQQLDDSKRATGGGQISEHRITVRAKTTSGRAATFNAPRPREFLHGTAALAQVAQTVPVVSTVKEQQQIPIPHTVPARLKRSQSR